MSLTSRRSRAERLKTLHTELALDHERLQQLQLPDDSVFITSRLVSKMAFLTRKELWVKQENETLFRRIKRTMSTPDATVITSALQNSIRGSPRHCDLALVQTFLIEIEKLSGRNLQDIYDELLELAIESDRPDLVNILGEHARQSTLEMLLINAIHDEAPTLMQELLRNGADPNLLPLDVIKNLMASKLAYFKLLLQSPERLTRRSLETLTFEAIHNDNHKALELLLKAMIYLSSGQMEKKQRDSYLMAALQANRKNSALTIILVTGGLHFDNVNTLAMILRDEFFATDDARTVLTAILLTFPEALSPTLSQLYEDRGLSGIAGVAEVLIEMGYPVPPEMFSIAWQQLKVGLLDVLLQDPRKYSGSFWSFTSEGDLNSIQLDMYEKILLKASRDGVRVPNMSRILPQAIESGRPLLVSSLISAGSSVNCMNGYPLRLALESGDELILQTVLRHANAESKQRLLLSTVFLAVPPSNQSFATLLDLISDDHSIIMLLTAMLSNPSTRHNREAIELLTLRATAVGISRNQTQNEMIGPWTYVWVEPSEVFAHPFLSDCHLTKKNDSSIFLSSPHLWNLFLEDLSDRHISDAFKAPANSHGRLAAHLLHDHTFNHVTGDPEAQLQPVQLFEILEQLAAPDCIYYDHALESIISYRQWHLLEMPLKRGVDKVSRVLECSKVSLNIADIGDLIELFNTTSKTSHEYSTLLKPIFGKACQKENLFKALERYSISTHRLRIAYILPSLVSALESEQNFTTISKLLSSSEVTQTHLGALWDSINLETGHAQASAVLRAGYTGTKIKTTLLACVENSDSTTVSKAIVQHLETQKYGKQTCIFSPETRTHLRSFHGLLDESTLNLKSQRSPTARRSVMSLFNRKRQGLVGGGFPRWAQVFSGLGSLIGEALSKAIIKQRVEFCRVFIEQKKPHPDDLPILLGLAVRYGDSRASLQEDHVVKIILEHTKPQPQYQCALDILLVEALHHRRVTLAKSLLDNGASISTWGYASGRMALMYPQGNAFETLFASPAPEHRIGMRSIIMPHFDRILKRGETENWVYAVVKCIEHAYVNAEQLTQLLPRLGASPWLQSGHIIELFENGASVAGDRNDENAVLVLETKNWKVFETLYYFCDLHTACELFERFCQIIVRPLPPHDSTAVSSTLQVLLHPGLPLFAIFAGFETLCRYHLNITSPGPISDSCRRRIVQALKMLQTRGMEKGMNFAQRNDECFYRCHKIADDELRSLIRSPEPRSGLLLGAFWLMLQEIQSFRDESQSYLTGFPHFDTAAGILRWEKLLDDMIPQLAEHPLVLTDSDMIKSFRLICERSFIDSSDFVRQFLYTRRDLHPKTGTCTQNDLDHLKDILLYQTSPSKQGPHAYTILEATQGLQDFGSGQKERSRYYLGQQRISDVLASAVLKGNHGMVSKLLELGASPQAQRTTTGKTVLFDATSAQYFDMVHLLCSFSKKIDEDSFLMAIKHGSYKILEFFMTFPHFDVKIWWCGCSFFSVFLRCDFPKFGNHPDFKELIRIIRLRDSEDQDAAKNWFSDDIIGNRLHELLERPHAFELCKAFISFLKPRSLAVTHSAGMLHSKGRLRYSLLSLVQHWDRVTMTAEQRAVISRSLVSLGYYAMYYAEDGEQPPEAVGIPEYITRAEEILHRRRAYETKVCSTCGEKAEREEDIHAGLVVECVPHHGWNDDIICSACLHTWLEVQMFPNCGGDSDRTKSRRFASRNVRCWSPKCHSTVLSYEALACLVDKEKFQDYDSALLNSCLGNDESIVKCAKPGCPVAVWFDSRQDKCVTLFDCHKCHTQTCRECNSLASDHPNRPCPARKGARNAELRREEDVSEDVLRSMKCPNPRCVRQGGVPYVKYEGCDEIVCGRNADDVTMYLRGCGYNFCHLCKGPWKPRSEHRTTCTHYGPD